MRSISRPISSVLPLAEEKPPLKALSSIDGGLVMATLLLAAIGLATVHSASSELALDYLPRQAAWVAAGLLLMVVAMSIDYHTLLDFSLGFYLLGIGALVLVLFVGIERGGAKSWFQIGPGQLQPSEFAKLATALLLARFLAVLNRRVLDLPQIAGAIGIVLAPMALIAVEPDLGGAAMLVPLLTGAILVAGVRWRLLAIAAVLLLVVGFGVWNFAMQDYQRQRVVTFLQPENDPLGAGYQVRQSKIAVGSGELTGKGYMQGTQSQLRFLPARHTEVVFEVLAEECGFLGSATLHVLYAARILSALKIAMRARDREGILLVVGLVSVSSLHVAYNTAMVVGFVPITGIPLPFLSYGGSFTLMNFAAAGLILNVDLRRYVNR